MTGDGDLKLPTGFVEQAAQWPACVRSLIVDNADPSTVSVDELLSSLGMGSALVPAYAGLRSLKLLSLLPKPAGTATDVHTEREALNYAGCEALRAAVDNASFDAADSCDGCKEYQLNLDRTELQRLVGTEAVQVKAAQDMRVGVARTVRPLRRTANVHSILHRVGPVCSAHTPFSLTLQVLWQLAVDALLRLPSEAVATPSDPAASLSTSALARLEAHEIFVRRYTAETRPWFPFHRVTLRVQPQTLVQLRVKILEQRRP